MSYSMVKREKGIAIAADASVYIHQKDRSIREKLGILTDAAKYDVACTSSGVDRRGTAKNCSSWNTDRGGLSAHTEGNFSDSASSDFSKSPIGNSIAAGICHSFSADGRCISLLKILMSNECIYDCKYCKNRISNDIERATFTPEEICTLTIDFYRRNYIEGLFLSSGVVCNPSYTMEKMYETIYRLRNQYHFQGYIHAKAIPGADPRLIQMLGFLVDRMSVNLELPTKEGLEKLAPNKNRKTILAPMRQIQNGILENKNEVALYQHAPTFVGGGQSTQMIIGATPETDYQIVNVAESLYQKFQLKRVFYSAYVQVNTDKELPALQGGPPLLREHRLYQADFLMRYYGFEAKELLSEDRPNFNVLLDPKADWALRHLELFPVEINRADYTMLLRVPGIGVKSAQKIVKARRGCTLTFEHLKKMNISLKRALYFITCGGRMLYRTKIEEDYITRNLLNIKEKLPFDVDGVTYKQVTLFDTGLFPEENSFREVLM